MGKPELLPSETLQPQISKAELIQQLSAILAPDALLHQREELKPFECDGLTAYQRMPLLVALPGNEEQVRAILRVCHAGRVPVVFRGAGTGLSGGALPYEHGLLLVMSKMKRILEIDAQARIARVQPGVRNAAISEATTPLGLYYAPDPSSQIACSIGGNVAENSGGVHCLKYGLTTNNVLGCEIVLMSGEIIRVGGKSLDAPGLDLMTVMVGSEG